MTLPGCQTVWILPTICKSVTTFLAQSKYAAIGVGTEFIEFIYFRYAAILLTPANIALRTEFGSLDQRITNIIYTNGAIDTWLYNGMLITRDYNATVFNIECK